MFKRTLQFMEEICFQARNNVSNQPQGPSLSSMLGGTGQPTAHGNTPQSLEQLLERQWEQGSQFLMEQAQHFDSKKYAFDFSCVYFQNFYLICLDDENVYFSYIYLILNHSHFSCFTSVMFTSVTVREYSIRRACEQFDCTT